MKLHLKTQENLKNYFVYKFSTNFVTDIHNFAKSVYIYFAIKIMQIKLVFYTNFTGLICT